MARRKNGVSATNYYKFLVSVTDAIRQAGEGEKVYGGISKFVEFYGLNAAVGKVVKDIGWLREVGKARYFWDGPKVITPRHGLRLMEACNSVGQVKKDSLLRLRLEGRLKALERVRDDFDRDIQEIRKLL